MKLRPIDFSILNQLTEGRNVAANIYLEIDSARQYVNERMAVLHDYGLIARVGPNENSGLYEITKKGRIALEYREDYSDDEVDFEELLENELAKDDLED